MNPRTRTRAGSGSAPPAYLLTTSTTWRTVCTTFLLTSVRVRMCVGDTKESPDDEPVVPSGWSDAMKSRRITICPSMCAVAYYITVHVISTPDQEREDTYLEPVETVFQSSHAFFADSCTDSARFEKDGLPATSLGDGLPILVCRHFLCLRSWRRRAAFGCMQIVGVRSGVLS